MAAGPLSHARAVALVAAALAAVAAVHFGPVRWAYERHLTSQARAAIAAQGMSDVAVTVAGTSVRLSGPVSQADGVNRAALAVGEIDGVSDVAITLVPGGSPDPAAAGAPAAAGPTPTASGSASQSASSGSASPSVPPGSSTAAAIDPAIDPAGDPATGSSAGADPVTAALAGLPAITFAPSSALLTADGRETLARAAGIMAAAPTGSRFRVEAHTDSVGTPEANLALSVERAGTVRDALASLGVTRRRLDAVGVGDTDPLVSPERTDADRLANRRVVITLLP